LNPLLVLVLALVKTLESVDEGTEDWKGEAEGV
jgi:hypothetical protein